MVPYVKGGWQIINARWAQQALITLLRCFLDSWKKGCQKTFFKKNPWLTPHSSYCATRGNTCAKGAASFILKIKLDQHDKPLLPSHHVFNQMEAAALSQNTFHSAIITPITLSEQTSAKIPTSEYITITVSPPSFHTAIILWILTSSDVQCAMPAISTANKHLLRWNIAEASARSRRPSSAHRRRPPMFFRAAKRSQLLCVLYSSFVVREADSHGKLVGAGRVLAGA